MLSSLNNRFCKPRVIFVGLEIGNTRQRRLFSFPLSLSARENCENETTVPGKRGRGRWRKEKRWKREKLIKKREREREGRMDKERAAQWNVYCPRCGPLAGYIRAHPPFARHAIKWSLVCELTRCKRARGKRSTPSPAVTAPDTAHVRVPRLQNYPHRNFGYHWRGRGRGRVEGAFMPVDEVNGNEFPCEIPR